MKNSFSLLSLAALLSLPAAFASEGTCPATASKTAAGTCAATQVSTAAAGTCAATQVSTAATGTCAATATASATCTSSKNQYVMLRVKGGKSVEQALGKLEGVSAVETCSSSKFTKVSYAQDKVCADKIMASIKEAGGSVKAQRVSFAVEGLACGACCDKVSKALSKVNGVSETKVCSDAKVATVDFDPNKVSASKVLAAIDATGFKATQSVN